MLHIPVTLTNQYAYLDTVGEDIYAKLNEAWSFFAPHAFHDRRYKLWLRERAKAQQRYNEGLGPDPDTIRLSGWDGKIHFWKQGSLPAGVFRATRRDLESQLGIKFIVTKNLPESPIVHETSPGTVDAQWAHQETCVVAMKKTIVRGGGTILSATGSGKTAIAGALFKDVSCSCLFVVDQLDLLYQSQKELSKWIGEPVGVVGDAKYTVERITVATIQTLKWYEHDPKFLKWYRSVQIVIVDELHVQMSRKNFDILKLINPMARFGLTATMQLSKKPVRMNMWAFCGPVIFEFPVAEGIEKGVLSKGFVLQLQFPCIDENDQLDYQSALRQEVLENEAKIESCVEVVRWLIEQGRYVLVLVSRVAHVKTMHKAFSGTKHRLAYGLKSKDKRQQAISLFEDGGIRLIIANGVFSKGVNLKRVDVVYDLAEMKDKNTVLQKFGRGVRLHKDKKELLYIDTGTEHGRFGVSTRSRARAIRAAGLPIRVVRVKCAGEALKAVMRHIKNGIH